MQTEIVRIALDEIEAKREHLERAADIIKRGGLVVFPTETVYGLGGDATNPSAAENIYTAKGRPSDNPLIIHIAQPSDAEKYAYTTPLYYKLADLYMPGPLTVVLKAKDTVPSKTRGGLDTVAVRCPENPIARELIKLSGVPIAAPSANLSGSPSPTCARHVAEDMMGRVDMIIDGGSSDIGLESTIVKLDGDSFTLLRPGKITAEELSVIAELSIADAVTDKLKEGERVLSPGMKYRHYAPTSPLILIDGEACDAIKYIGEHSDKRIAVLCYREQLELFRSGNLNADLYEFGSKDDESAQAHQLFTLLRDVDKGGYDTIFAPLPEKRGLGLALYNRMIRAAAHTIINLRR